MLLGQLQCVSRDLILCSSRQACVHRCRACCGEACASACQQGGVYFLVDDKGNKDPKHVLKARCCSPPLRSADTQSHSVDGHCACSHSLPPPVAGHPAQHCPSITHSAASSMCTAPPVAALGELSRSCRCSTARAPVHAFAMGRAGQAPLRAAGEGAARVGGRAARELAAEPRARHAGLHGHRARRGHGQRALSGCAPNI